MAQCVDTNMGLSREDSLTQLTYEVESRSPSNARTLERSPSNSQQPMDMKSLMLSSNLMGKTQGLVPFSGFLEPRASKGGGGEHAVKSQLEPNLVPHKEALSTLIEAGAIYGLQHTHKDTESHIGKDLVPQAEYDAGIGFEGWYSNGDNGKNMRPNHQSHIDPHNGAVNDDAAVWTEGWYNGQRGSCFALPVKHNRRSTGMQRVEPTFDSPPIMMRDDVAFKPPPRNRAVQRKSPTGEMPDSQWTTSYDTQFSPMNERKLGARSKSKAKLNNKKKKQQFTWKRREREAPRGPAPWAPGAKKVGIPTCR